MNPADTSLLGGGGGDVNGAIHGAGDKAILHDCQKIIAWQGGCKVGKAVMTIGENLLVMHVIHTVGPAWNGNNNKEEFVGGIAEFKINSQLIIPHNIIRMFVAR